MRGRGSTSSRPFKRPRPRVLVLSGLEPSGRAGLLADVAAIRAKRGEAWGLATALTAQGGRHFSVEPVSPRVLRRQLSSLLAEGGVDAVKVGMVATPAALGAIAEAVLPLEVPCVVDPVVQTSRGERLSSLSPADFLRLAGPRVVLTPNLAEAAWLLGRRPSRTPAEAEPAARALAEAGFLAVILKGGHAAGAPTDLVCVGGSAICLRGRRVARTPQHRGTGCRFASVLALELARGRNVVAAAKEAKSFVERYLQGV